MCAGGNRPLAIVEDAYFREFCGKISQGKYQLPSRKTLRSLARSMAAQVRVSVAAELKRDIGDGATIVLTFDAWTDT